MHSLAAEFRNPELKLSRVDFFSHRNVDAEMANAGRTDEIRGARGPCHARGRYILCRSIRDETDECTDAPQQGIALASLLGRSHQGGRADPAQ
jgi:hypothetical protein